LTGAGGEFADDPVHHRLLGLTDRAGGHGPQRDAIRVEIAERVDADGQDEADDQARPAGDDAADENEQGTEEPEEDRRLESVAYTVPMG
jgi:hypothetical protein